MAGPYRPRLALLGAGGTLPRMRCGRSVSQHPPKRRRMSTKTPEVMPAVGASAILPGEQVILPNDEEEAKPELMQDKRFKLTYLVGGLPHPENCDESYPADLKARAEQVGCPKCRQQGCTRCRIWVIKAWMTKNNLQEQIEWDISNTASLKRKKGPKVATCKKSPLFHG